MHSLMLQYMSVGRGRYGCGFFVKSTVRIVAGAGPCRARRGGNQPDARRRISRDGRLGNGDAARRRFGRPLVQRVPSATVDQVEQAISNPCEQLPTEPDTRQNRAVLDAVAPLQAAVTCGAAVQPVSPTSAKKTAKKKSR